MTRKKIAERLDQMDRKASKELNGKRDAWWMRAIGLASDIGDQPQMRLLCATVLAAGALRRDRKLAMTGIRMFAAHTIATWGKNGMKAVVDRTRPNSMQDGYKFRTGNSDAHSETSFPSGHSAGIVAAAQAFARSYPDHDVAVRTVAGTVAAIQVARGEHFIGDVVTGSLIGIVAERLTHTLCRPRSSVQS